MGSIKGRASHAASSMQDSAVRASQAACSVVGKATSAAVTVRAAAKNELGAPQMVVALYLRSDQDEERAMREDA
eukprot:3120387-Rhodomonas_salina.1